MSIERYDLLREISYLKSQLAAAIERAEKAEARASALHKAHAELVQEVFGPEREQGEPLPEGLGVYDHTTAWFLDFETKHRAALKEQGGA